MNDINKYIFYSELILTILCKARCLNIFNNNNLVYVSKIRTNYWNIWFSTVEVATPTIEITFNGSTYMIGWYRDNALNYQTTITCNSFRDIEKYLELWIKLYPNLPS